MTTSVGSIRLDTTVLDRLTAETRPRAGVIVMETAFLVEGDAKMLAPVDTGALKNSLHTERKGDLMATVSDGMEYGIFQELGTSRMRAQPFMVPALEKNRTQFVEKFRGLLR